MCTYVFGMIYDTLVHDTLIQQHLDRPSLCAPIQDCKKTWRRKHIASAWCRSLNPPPPPPMRGIAMGIPRKFFASDFTGEWK